MSKDMGSISPAFLAAFNYTTLIFFKYINTFIQQGFIKLIKCDSKDIYNVTKHLF